MIGIDVGGANLKIADSDGIHIHYCPLWEGSPVTALLSNHRHGPDEPAAVVMSGELADCFSDKQEGIAWIVGAVRAVFPGARFYGTDGVFHPGAVPQLAAANWLASADYLRDRFPDAVLVDMGSTTTDIVPLALFPGLLGMTDLRRLQNGYLLYTGMLRTTLPALIRTVRIDGIRTPVSSEYFAASADAHLVLGHITPAGYSCATPDGKEKSATASLRRLARVVCADIAEIGTENAAGIARQFWDAQRKFIRDRVETVIEASGASSVIVAGIGSALFARELCGSDLREILGPAADALPAFAVREIALREQAIHKRSRSGNR